MADLFIKSLLQNLKEQQTKDVQEIARLKGLTSSVSENVRERAEVITVLEKTMEIGVNNILNK